MNSCVPLGDQAVLAYLADEVAALRFATRVRRANDPWLVDVVQAYTSVGVFFDLNQIRYGAVVDQLRRFAMDPTSGSTSGSARHRIPCCYEFPLDLARVVEHTRLSADEVIRLHWETEYTVYAIGFCPGFPYLGYLPPSLSGVPRLPCATAAGRSRQCRLDRQTDRNLHGTSSWGLELDRPHTAAARRCRRRLLPFTHG